MLNLILIKDFITTINQKHHIQDENANKISIKLKKLT
jgi:hypothetical protein